MIKHIVMYKLKEVTEDGSKAENKRKMKSLLEALNGKVPGLLKLEVGFNFEASNTAYDIVLYSEFKDLQALETYQNHPEHLKAKDFVGRSRETRAVVDYEVEG